MLSFKINDLKDQEVVGKFSDVMTFSKTDFKPPASLAKEVTGKLYRLEIVWQNSRKTRLTCDERKYNEFCKAHDRYTEWLQNNPDLEQSRLDMAVLNEVIKQAIYSSAVEVSKVGETIKEQLIELNNELSSNLIKREETFVKQAADKINIMEERSESLKDAMLLVSDAVSLIKNFVPENMAKDNAEKSLDINSLNKETVSE